MKDKLFDQLPDDQKFDELTIDNLEHSVPGALPPELYRLLDRALSHDQFEPDQPAIRALASQIPEIDADLWVHEFSSLDLHRDPGEQDEVASDDE